MNLPRPGDHAFAGADITGGGESRLSRPAVVVSLLAHVALVLAVGRMALDQVETAPDAATAEFLWLGDLVRSIEAPEPAAPAPEESAASPPEPAPVPRPTAPRPTVAAPTDVPAIESPPQEASAEAPATPAGPSRLDLDTARREAAAAVVEEHARAGKVLSFSLDDVMPPRAAPAPKKPSIFDYHSSAGSGVLSPGKARTAVGFKMRMWCNRVTGGGINLVLGFFSLPVCMSGKIEGPSGVLADSIPEYMKLKPECEETRPLAAALGETSPYPTVKCRLVPKDTGETAVLGDGTGR
jgi:hypothetical protein